MMRAPGKAPDGRLQELTETLAGTRRSGARGQAAVRLDDLAGLLDLSPTLRSTQAAGAAPTAAEFDALVADVHALHEKLLALATALQLRRGGR